MGVSLQRVAMDWTVRPAAAADAGALALVGGATFLETFAGVLDGDAILAHVVREHTPEAYRRHLGSDSVAWLAEVAPGGAPVGFALLAPADLPGAQPDDLELKRIYTLARFHGTGVGQALMAQAVACAAERRSRRLLLGVYAGNERAQAFYRKHGFARIAERQFRVGDRLYDDIIFARPL